MLGHGDGQGQGQAARQINSTGGAGPYVLRTLNFTKKQATDSTKVPKLGKKTNPCDHAVSALFYLPFPWFNYP